MMASAPGPSGSRRSECYKLGVLTAIFCLIPLFGCSDDTSPVESQPEIHEDTVAVPDISPEPPDADEHPEDAAPETAPSRECEVDADCAGVIRRPGQCEVRYCDTETGQCKLEERPDGAPCDTGDPCTIQDTCRNGSCVAGFYICECSTDDDCADPEDRCKGLSFCDLDANPPHCRIDPATVVTCDRSEDTACLKTDCVPETGECVTSVVNVGGPCNDGDPCTTDTHCQPDGTCVGTDSCQCREDSDCLEYEDGNLCNGVLFCDSSQIPYECRIKPGSVVICPRHPETNQCRRNKCQPETGHCVLTNEANGTECQTTNLCTVQDYCEDGTCRSGVVKDCNDGNPCTNNGCNPQNGQCTSTPNTASCDDEFACTKGDYCQNGQCRQGTPIVCDDGDPCTVGTCVEPDGCRFTFDPTLCPPSDTVQETEIGEPEIVEPQDVTSEDVAEVTPPDPWEGRSHGLYRLTALGWSAPPMCLVIFEDEPCVDVTGTIASEVDNAVAAGDLVVLTELTPLDLTADPVALRHGEGACTGPETCDFKSEPPPAFMDATMRPEGECGIFGTAPPCFEAGPETVALSLFGDPPMTLLGTNLEATFALGYSALEEGYLRGFLSEAEAAAQSVMIAGVGDVALATMLPGDMIELHDDQPGWWVTLPFEAIMLPDHLD